MQVKALSCLLKAKVIFILLEQVPSLLTLIKSPNRAIQCIRFLKGFLYCESLKANANTVPSD